MGRMKEGQAIDMVFPGDTSDFASFAPLREVI